MLFDRRWKLVGRGWVGIFYLLKMESKWIAFSNQRLDAHLTSWSLRMPLVEGSGCYLIVHFCFLGFTLYFICTSYYLFCISYAWLLIHRFLSFAGCWLEFCLKNREWQCILVVWFKIRIFLFPTMVHYQSFLYNASLISLH